MDKLRAMAIFVAVAEEQGFAAASRRVSLSPPAVTRAIAELESLLGVQLMIRTTRRIRLTDAGQQYLLDARRILADVDGAEQSVAGIHAKPSGHLVITAPAMFGRLYVMPVITDFLKRYEQVTVSTLFVDRVTNLLEEGLDLGVRIGELPDSSLRAIRLGSVSLKTYAAPDYLERFGTPDSPEALHQHRLIVSTAGNRGTLWRYHDEGREIALKVSPALTSNTNDSVIAAAVSGFGITRVLSYQAAPQVASGHLLPILESFDGELVPVSLVHPQGRNVSAKVRAFIDLAVSTLRQQAILMPDKSGQIGV